MLETGNSLLATVVVAVIVLVFLRWWKKSRQGELLSLIVELVAAAEQVYGAKSGSTKLTWVLEQIKVRFPGVDIALARTLIEAAVHRQESAKPQKSIQSAPVSRANGYDHR
jgi:hypothetical protein